MYKKGQVEIDEIMDSQNDYEEVLAIYLPHSCDEWVIGGVKEAEMMIEDLKEAIKKFRD